MQSVEWWLSGTEGGENEKMQSKDLNFQLCNRNEF